MSRPAVAHIDLAALRSNYRLAKTLHGKRVLAVVKADAYGHGAVRCAQALPEADGFAVAAIEEALSLRAAGITAPILLLEGFFEAAELPVIAREKLWTVIHHRWQVDALVATELREPIEVWLKFNSGMNRVGLNAAEFRWAFDSLARDRKVSNIILMTHFARADEPAADMTERQIDRFLRLTEGMNRELSASNSAGLMRWPRARADWGRAGIMLYGADPFAITAETRIGLRPVMHLHSKIIATQEVEAGESVGYGAGYVAARRTCLGVVACGYADGYPRAASSGTPVSVDGRRSALAGRVSMDMLAVDLTDLPDAGIGSSVELWGGTVPITEVASRAGTIAYELMCNLKRVRMAYRG